MGFNVKKMHGLGNSYVIFTDLQRREEHRYRQLAIALSDKNFGIGSDGILVVNSGSKARYHMRIFNPDGSEAEMCGNGVRIFAKYLRDASMADECGYVEVGGRQGGKLVFTNILEDGRIAVDMGKGELLGELKIEVGREEITGTKVSMGNPHFVVFNTREDYAKACRDRYGRKIEVHEAFGDAHTNVEFAVTSSDKKSITMYVWERGAGPTLACGTGACATFVAAESKGLVGKDAEVTLEGGKLNMIMQSRGNIVMIGPANYSIREAVVDFDEIRKTSVF